MPNDIISPGGSDGGEISPSLLKDMDTEEVKGKVGENTGT